MVVFRSRRATRQFVVERAAARPVLRAIELSVPSGHLLSARHVCGEDARSSRPPALPPFDAHYFASRVKKRTSGDNIGRGDVGPRCCRRDLANGADRVCAT